jgi:hypothetical protein
MDVIAVGAPGWPLPSTSWDWSPHVCVVVALFLARYVMGLRLTAGTIGVCALAGTLLAPFVVMIGYPLSILVAWLLCAFVRVSLSRGRTR